MRAPEIDLSKLPPILAYGRTESDLIPLLQKVQEEYGYVPPETLTPIGDQLKIPPSRVQGVINFYAMFYTEPRGRNVVTVCRGTACHVRGGKGVLRVVQKILGLKDGETSEDYQFTLETVACLGACALSPVMVVNGQVYGRMNPKRIETVLVRYMKEGDD
ncbi:MAG: NADH-quinone oxidoreductase subunit NuoE [Proteobacteria bacterium]|nr:NADH-quinone oxidoreductase subunit NuoE [Pseudomonadota bacterium]